MKQNFSMEMYFLLTFLILTFSIGNIQCQSYNTVSTLKSDIFKNYDKTIRPSSDHGYPIFAFLELVLIGISDLDEVSEKLTTTGYLYITWQDENLIWDPTSYGNTEYLYIPQNEIWKPDIQLKNGFQEFKQMGGSFMYIELWNNGLVIWKPFQTFQTKCKIAIKYFPFDIQICDITFIVWSMTIWDVNITEWEGNVDLYFLESNGEWDVVSTKASSKADGTEAEVTFSLTLKRKPLNILLNLLIPLILLTVLDIFTFMIPVDSGEKISYCMTVFLSFAVFLTIVSDQLPGNSDGLSLLGIYLLMMLSQGCVIVFITTIQLRLYFRNSEIPVPNALTLMTKLALFMQCRNKPTRCCRSKRSKPNEIYPVEEKQESDSFSSIGENINWKQVVGAIDYFMFVLTLVHLIVTTTVLCVLALYGE